MSGLIGKWHFSTTENFDEYMQALGKYQTKSTSITKVTRTHSSGLQHWQPVAGRGRSRGVPGPMSGGLRDLRFDVQGGRLGGCTVRSKA